MDGAALVDDEITDRPRIRLDHEVADASELRIVRLDLIVMQRARTPEMRIILRLLRRRSRLRPVHLYQQGVKPGRQRFALPERF